MPDWLSWSTILTALAGVIAIVAAIVSSVETSRDAKEQNRLLTTLDEKNEQVISALTELDAKNNQLAGVLTELDAKNKQVIAAQQESLDTFTGGDSIFYLHFTDQEGNVPVAHFRIDGKHPVPSPFLQIIDVTKAIELKADEKSRIDINAQSTTRIELGTVWPDSGLGTVRFPFREDGKGFFLIHIFQPRGKYLQFLKMSQLPDGSHIYAYQVYRQVREHEGKTEIELLPTLYYCDPRVADVEPLRALLTIPSKVHPSFALVDPAE
jgi:hypothetical protein